MSYESVDKLQNLLAENIFSYTSDRKKAAGRALGTFLEIITYYLIKTWRLETFAAIERPLPEFANYEITHNVEFTLHGSQKICEGTFSKSDVPISNSFLLKKHCELKEILKSQKNKLVEKDFVLRNACTLFADEDIFFNAYVNSKSNLYEIFRLQNHPFAMFECKRVGIEAGMKKGPQTIEKAKQGSYVARTVSALQRVRMSDGSIAGFLQKDDGTFLMEDYYSLLNKIIDSSMTSFLKNFILTVGVVSNHGNWFTSENPNKELKILAQSYDWLIFLTDKGISEFITELLIKPEQKYSAVQNAFNLSYNKNKKGNVFTKVKMNLESDIALCEYFKMNVKRIESWFNVISPKQKSINDMKDELLRLSKKDWQKIYAEK